MDSKSGTSEHYLRLAGLSKMYGSAVALDSIDLDVRRGEFLTLLGGSGSGKTTTLNCVAGFVEASAGTIELHGTVINRLPAHKRNVGVVFQNYALFPHMTVAENVAYPLRARRFPRTEIAERVTEALRTVRLGNYADRLPAALSGGQQQRVAMARAVVYRPDLLLLDEPLGALDKNLREQLQLEIMRLHRELGITVIAVTHDQEEALTMSDRIAVYRSGRIAQIGTADELYTRPNSRFVAEFIGESNAFVGTAVPGPNGHSLNVAGLGSLTTPAFDPALASGTAVLIVRPEAMTIQRTNTVASGNNSLAARVVDSVYVGSSRKYIVRTADGVERQVRVPASPDDFERGETIRICWSGTAGTVLKEEGAA